MTSDPLTDAVTLLQPSARFSKVVTGNGRWRIRRTECGDPFYCVVLDGGCRLSFGQQSPITLMAGDFVLIPAAYDFCMTSLLAPDSPDEQTVPVMVGHNAFHLGDACGEATHRVLVGHCSFGSPNAALLVSLLPQFVHVRGEPRLATLVQLVGEESRTQRPGRDVILTHLLEVMLIEALRSTASFDASPGLLRALSDARLAAAIRRVHDDPTRPWNVAELAKEAALSRSAFFERFQRAMGVSPMEYLLAWRMALAKNLLRHHNVADVATRVGYRSASTFSVAFTRFVGQPPSHYAQGMSLVTV